MISELVLPTVLSRETQGPVAAVADAKKDLVTPAYHLVNVKNGLPFPALASCAEDETKMAVTVSASALGLGGQDEAQHLTFATYRHVPTPSRQESKGVEADHSTSTQTASRTSTATASPS